ncbi:MAG: FCD domain-containing protein [Thermovirgaceae bacterium]
MFNKLSSGKKSSSVMKQILEAIEEGRLKESDKLPNELNLAKQFGVSRSVIREATSGLVAMGVIKRVPGTGTFVQQQERSFAPMVAQSASFWEEIQGAGSLDAYIARLIIEPIIWEYTAGRIKPKDLRSLKTILKRMQNAIGENDFDGYRELDISFHLQLAKSSGNQVLFEIMKKFINLTGLDRWEIEKIWPTNNFSINRSLDDHRELLQMLERGTPQEVRSKLEAHLRAAFWEYGSKNIYND